MKPEEYEKWSAKHCLDFIDCNKCRIGDICSIRENYEKIYADVVLSTVPNHGIIAPKCRYYENIVGLHDEEKL
jgi:hypothetical protein